MITLVPMRSILLALSVVSIALAGCAGGGSKDVPPSGTSAAPPTVDDTTGSIHGFVIDDQVLQVEGAEVAIPSLGLSTVSDAQGEFTLNGVPPGEHTLFANKLGYEAGVKRVQVEVGQVLEVQLTLVPIAVAEPRMESFPFAGQFECSGAALDVYWFECPGSSTLFPSSKSAFYFDKPTGVTHIVAELRWTSASAGTGQNLDFNLVAGEDRDDSQWYANVFGPSPLQILITVGEKFENPNSPAAVGSSSQDQVVDDEDKRLGVNIYASPSYYQDVATVGLTLQQRYEGMVTFFYDMDVPEGFSAFPDA